MAIKNRGSDGAPDAGEHRFMDVAAIARELGVSERTAYRKMKQMIHMHVGSLLKVQRVHFENWIRKQETAPADAGARTRATPADAPTIRPTQPRTKPRPKGER